MSQKPILNSQSIQTNFNMNNLKICNVLRVDSARRTCRIRSIEGVDYVCGYTSSFLDDSIPANDSRLRALVDFNQSEPIILAFMPLDSGAANDNQVQMSPTTGFEEKDRFESLFSEDESYVSFNERKIRKNFRGDKPYDMIPGDKLIRNHYEGNHILIGRGGINVLKVSDTNQIIQSLLDNLTRILARNFQLYTDAGQLVFDNTDNKTKMDLRLARNHIGKVKDGVHDVIYQIGNCDDGNTVSFQYITEKSQDPYIFTIDRKGQEFKSVPSDSVTIYNQNKIDGITENKATSVAKKYLIDVGDYFALSTSGAGSIKLGSENLNENNNALVRKPHLDKYYDLENALLQALIVPTLPLPFLPLAVRSPKLALLAKELGIQIPLVKQDKTTKVWGE